MNGHVLEHPSDTEPHMSVNERRLDLLVSRLLEDAGIAAVPNGSGIREVHEALCTSSKRGTSNHGYPEYTAKSGEFIIVIEDKGDLSKQAKYEDETSELSMDTDSVCNFALNGALHYAQNIISKTNFDRVFAFGCSGDEIHHEIRPMFVNPDGYVILDPVDNFENFSESNIDAYYREQVLKETPMEEVELEKILAKASNLHEYLRSYGSLGDKEKPLVVSAILLALSESTFNIDNLKGDSKKTDGLILYNDVRTYLDRVDVSPETKRDMILSQFSILKDRTVLNQVNPSLGKTPLRFFVEYIKENIKDSMLFNSPEDVLGRFYGEFVRYTGGDGQSLGVVLTPKHITTLFCDLLDVKKDDVVFDPCCGTGGFLVAAMHAMISDADGDVKKIEHIQRLQIHGIEARDDMFSIATTNMILRGDGKSNLICNDFFNCSSEELRKKGFTVGMMNPPYGQGKKGDWKLTEISFTNHLLESMSPGGRVAIIVPQSTMIGKTTREREIKKRIMENHTLEGVITLNKNTFYGIGTNPCIAVFTAWRPHPPEKRCKFVNFEDDGFVVSKHVGLVETERAKGRRQFLMSCWKYDAPAETRFIVRSTVKPEDEWLHSYFYFNDEIPTDADFEKTMADYLTFEFNMIVHGRGYLFESRGGK